MGQLQMEDRDRRWRRFFRLIGPGELEQLAHMWRREAERMEMERDKALDEVDRLNLKLETLESAGEDE